MPMLIDLILSHPGLHFLREAPQFYGKYAEVVTVRIFWTVDRTWSGRLTAPMLRRSNFLPVLRSLEVFPFFLNLIIFFYLFIYYFFILFIYYFIYFIIFYCLDG
jgi:serine/threonine-protein phosphatase 2A regulatory subunit B''